MKPGMETLLNLLRGQRPVRDGDPYTSEVEWDTVITLAERENILPFAASLLRSQQIAPTPAFADRITRIERNAAIAAFYWTSELRDVLHAFASQQVPVVPLKGPFLATPIFPMLKPSSPPSASPPACPTTITAPGRAAPPWSSCTTMSKIRSPSTSTRHARCVVLTPRTSRASLARN